MALMYSQMMDLKTLAPSFNLLNTVTGSLFTLSDVHPRIATVILFICNHCPYVHHIKDRLAEIARSYDSKEVQFIAISSNDVMAYPEDAPEKMKTCADEWGFSFPYLYDETQEVAKAYKAACTPDIFIFDKEMRCAYRGRFDESSPGKGQATGLDMTNALEALKENRTVDPQQHPSMGCSIKWKD